MIFYFWFIYSSISFISNEFFSATIVSMYFILWGVWWSCFLLHSSTALSFPRHSTPVLFLKLCYFLCVQMSKPSHPSFFCYVNNVVLDIHNVSNFQVPNFIFISLLLSKNPCCVANNVFAWCLPNVQVSAPYKDQYLSFIYNIFLHKTKFSMPGRFFLPIFFSQFHSNLSHLILKLVPSILNLLNFLIPSL